MIKCDCSWTIRHPKHESDCALVKSRLVEDRPLGILRVKAQEVWDAMDKNDRGIIRIGMIPIDAVRRLEAYGDSRELMLALVDCAKNDGGMRV